MHISKLYISLLLVVTLITGLKSDLFAQYNTSSPYSAMGVGNTDLIFNGAIAGMGGTSIAIRNNNYLNPGNPASYTGLDSIRFYYEVSLVGRVTWASTSQFNSRLDDGNVSSVIMGTRVTDKWGMGFGLIPETQVGYNLRVDNWIDGKDQEYPTYWEGSGGLFEMFLDNGYKLFDGFSVGLRTAFLFGPLDETKQVLFASPASIETTTYRNQYYYRGFKAEAGLQYEKSIGEDKEITIGATFSPKVAMYGDYIKYIAQTSTANSLVDTLFYQDVDYSTFDFPETYGLGVAYSNKTTTVSADARYANWSSLSTLNETYRDQLTLSAGMEYVKDPLSRKWSDKVAYRCGLKYDTGYLQFYGGQSVIDYRATLGAGLPIGRGGDFINIAFEGGKKGSFKEGLVEELYFGAILSFSMSETWFFKRKYN